MREALRRARLLVRMSMEATRRNTILEFVLAPFEMLGTLLGTVLFKLGLDAVVEENAPATVIAFVLAVEIAGTGVVQAFHTRVSGDVIERCRERFDREIVSLTASIPTIEHHENPAYLAELEFCGPIRTPSVFPFHEFHARSPSPYRSWPSRWCWCLSTRC